MPPSLAQRVLGYSIPPLFGLLAGFLMGRGFAKRAVETRQFTEGPIAKGHLFGGLLATASAIALWQAFCINCIAQNALYVIIGLAIVTTLLAFSWTSKRS